jgi:hypothetical protein
MTYEHTRQTWNSVREQLQSGRSITIAKSSGIPHPRNAGARLTSSWPIGQLADYALDFPGAAPLLVHEFVDRYEAVILGVQFADQAVRLIETNPRAALYVGATLLGATLGAAITRQRNGLVVGAAFGALAAALIHAASQPGKQETPA